ncbi:hypothetical protein [Amycolatopsis sp. MtRt-6]|uniref:hypothetical protein n=1 Tax=Amycolatopsis sp. MtRt-6 TaxID=2792782 RepID=UPI001A8F6B83|nr:hypothetical protein [Amycolatopsis sp. MtRt-6]
MLAEDAHRRMTETLRRAAGEPEPDSFPARVRWDPAAPGDERSALLGRYARWCGRGARLKSRLDLFEEVPAAVFVVSAVGAPRCRWGAGNLGPVVLAGGLAMVFATVIISSIGVFGGAGRAGEGSLGRAQRERADLVRSVTGLRSGAKPEK